MANKLISIQKHFVQYQLQGAISNKNKGAYLSEFPPVIVSKKSLACFNTRAVYLSWSTSFSLSINSCKTDIKQLFLSSKILPHTPKP